MDSIDRWLNRNSAKFMNEREVEAKETLKEEEKPLTDQERWEKAMREMGWFHLIKKEK